jgi:hypothetical protein
LLKLQELIDFFQVRVMEVSSDLVAAEQFRQ